MHLITLNKVDYNQYAEGQDLEPQVVTTPVVIAPSTVRCMYARKQNRPGTRITFADGGGFAVLESLEQIIALMIECGFTGSTFMAVAPQPVAAAAAPVSTALAEGQTVN